MLCAPSTETDNAVRVVKFQDSSIFDFGFQVFRVECVMVHLQTMLGNVTNRHFNTIDNVMSACKTKPPLKARELPRKVNTVAIYATKTYIPTHGTKSVKSGEPDQIQDMKETATKPVQLPQDSTPSWSRRSEEQTVTGVYYWAVTNASSWKRQWRHPLFQAVTPFPTP